jgi:hypothetical protein
MAYYTVVTPCVVGQLHYAHVPDQPIDVDDHVAADLVTSGVLVPYRPGQAPDVDRDPVDTDTEGDPETPARTRRRRPHEG